VRKNMKKVIIGTIAMAAVATAITIPVRPFQFL
jgi:hypothetical protein